MRDPVRRVDPIEETCRFLKGCMESESWRADPDGRAYDIHAAIDEVEASNLPDWAKTTAIFALLKLTKKRPARKPTRRNRDNAIREAAIKLVMRGYKPTRNDVTRDRDSASSIIHQALRRLGEKMSEKSINAVMTKLSADHLIKQKVPPAFMEYLREHAPGIADQFESDPNAPEIVDMSGEPVVLK
jgi:hypothetical protein